MDTGQIRSGVINRITVPIFGLILLPLSICSLFPAINDRSRYISIRPYQTDRSTLNLHISWCLCIIIFSHPNMGD